MKSFAKNLFKKTVPAVLAASATAAVAADHPATQPAASPAPQVQTAQNNLPLVIPDGTTGPVVQRGTMSGFEMDGLRQ